MQGFTSPLAESQTAAGRYLRRQKTRRRLKATRRQANKKGKRLKSVTIFKNSVIGSWDTNQGGEMIVLEMTEVWHSNYARLQFAVG